MDRQTTLRSTIATTDQATGRKPATRRTSVIKRAAILALAVMASTVALHPSPTLAAVSVGDGSADETVYCNSRTHTIQVTTTSTGIPSNVLGTSPGGLFSQYVNYRVWLKVLEYVNGQWVPTSVHLWPDGMHTQTFAATAGQTSYWYFQWGFETPYNTVVWQSEYAGGYGAYGWYSDQNGYRSLTSCRT